MPTAPPTAHFQGIHPAALNGIEPPRGVVSLYPPRAACGQACGYWLFGLLVVDPPTRRASADELVLLMGGDDLNNGDRDESYAFNGFQMPTSMIPIE